MRKVTIKQKQGMRWAEIEMPKGSAPDILRGFQGHPIVVQVDTGNGIVYFCGDEASMVVMAGKGVTISCEDAAKFYDNRQQPIIETIATAFTEQQSERIAIKMESGISATEALQQTLCGV